MEKDQKAFQTLIGKLDGSINDNNFKTEFEKGWRIHHMNTKIGKSYIAFCLEQHFGEGVFQSEYFCVSETALKEKVNFDGKEMKVYEIIGQNKKKVDKLIENYGENGMFNLEIKDPEIIEYIEKLGNEALLKAFQIKIKSNGDGKGGNTPAPQNEKPAESKEEPKEKAEEKPAEEKKEEEQHAAEN